MRDLAEILRANIKGRLQLLGMNDADLAKKAGITKTYVSQLLRDKPEGRNENPGIKQLQRIAEALETTASRLLAGPEDRPNPLQAIDEAVRLWREFRAHGIDSAEIRALFGHPPKK